MGRGGPAEEAAMWGTGLPRGGRRVAGGGGAQVGHVRLGADVVRRREEEWI